MTAESTTWTNLRMEYLNQVERALSSVKHPRAQDVLEDVAAHLERRWAELPLEQRTDETLRAIIADMGPAADYAVLLDPDNAVDTRRVRKRPILWAGVIGVAALVLIVLAGHALVEMVTGPRPGDGDSPAGAVQAATSNPAPVHIVTFGPAGSFRPRTARALLDAFNEKHPRNVRTHHFRTQIKDDALIGFMCVDTDAGRDAVLAMLKASDKLESIEATRATPVMLQELYDRKQVSLPSESRGRAASAAPVYIVTFRPIKPFAPRTSRDLLNAFNANHPRGVRTHHYRTQVKGDALIGFICVDTEAGKDAVGTMLTNSEKLELVEAVRATPEALERLYNRKQVSLPSMRHSSTSSRRTSRPVREPVTFNRTLTKKGTWPPGNCSISGYISRRARISRVDHAKVCLSSDQFGSWVVAADRSGNVDFGSIPAGTYRFHTVDTAGYRDAYFNPLNQENARPTFVLEEGDRLRARIEIEPLQPYRKITGRVLDVDGKPLAGCERLSAMAWGRQPQGTPISRSFVQADGSYVLDELDGRPVYVQICEGRPPVQDEPLPPRFHPGTFCRNEADLVTFGDAAIVEHIDIVMQRTGGRVLEGLVAAEASGRPVPQALVTVFHRDMLNDLFYTYTDEQGRYRLEGLGGGKLIVHVDAVHQGYVKTRRMSAMSGPAKRRLDFTLKGGANIGGVLVDQAGRPYRVGRGRGYASRRKGGFAARARNFSYGNKYAPEHIRNGPTVFYHEGEGDAMGTMMIFPCETTFLLPAVAPGDVLIRFSPRGPGERVAKILYEGRDLLKTGLTVEAGVDITDVTIVVERPKDS